MTRPNAPTVDRRHSTRITTGFYIVVVAIALLGNATANWGAVFLPLPALVWYGIKAITAAALELGGVVLAVNADTRRRLGERALSWRTASAGVALLAISINLLGHWSEPIFAGIFTGFSALGYAVFLISSGDRRRDQLRAEGKLPPTAPSYGIRQWLTEPGLTREAKALALADPTLGLYLSLHAAREARRQAHERAALKSALRDLLCEGVHPSRRALALASYDLDAIVANMRAEADNQGVADALRASIQVHRITAQVRAQRRVSGAAGGAQGGAVPTRSRRGRGPRDAKGARAARGWWTRERDAVYTRYADQLDAGQGEMTAEEMRADMGLESSGGARNVRDSKLRPRYAREVAERVRRPVDATALPTSVQGLIAAHQVRELGPELRVATESDRA